VALARALVLQPRILLLDEITSALDPETTYGLIAAIRKLRDAESLVNETAARRMGIILVTHAFRFAESFADRIALLSNGRIVEIHPARSFRADCRHEDAKRYLQYVT
jgi:ABC-type polar amino acid transport system ATPase subunit